MQSASIELRTTPLTYEMNKDKEVDPVNKSISEEASWLRLIGFGNQEAMNSLVDKWQNPLYRYFYRSLNNHADSQDLTQKTFLKAFKAAKKYQPISKFSTWIFTIARNLLIDEIKRKQKFSSSQIFVEDIHSKISYGVDEVTHLNEILQLALDEMQENHRSALLFRVQQEWSYSEIADAMKTNQQQVKTWIYRARQKLKERVLEIKKSERL